MKTASTPYFLLCVIIVSIFIMSGKIHCGEKLDKFGASSFTIAYSASNYYLAQINRSIFPTGYPELKSPEFSAIEMTYLTDFPIVFFTSDNETVYPKAGLGYMFTIGSNISYGLPGPNFDVKESSVSYEALKCYFGYQYNPYETIELYPNLELGLSRSVFSFTENISEISNFGELLGTNTQNRTMTATSTYIGLGAVLSIKIKTNDDSKDTTYIFLPCTCLFNYKIVDKSYINVDFSLAYHKSLKTIWSAGNTELKDIYMNYPEGLQFKISVTFENVNGNKKVVEESK